MNPQKRSEIRNRLDELEILIANTFAFDREQASQYTQVGERTIRALVDEKKLEATFFSPRNLRVKRSSIDEYAKKNTVK
ncbi:excisionase family DNA-binding protein [Corynebacterium diphtheriae]